MKYIVGAQQPSVTWQNTQPLGGYDPDRIRALDPVVLGAGDRLFHTGQEISLAVQDSETYENGVLHVTYTSAPQR